MKCIIIIKTEDHFTQTKRSGAPVSFIWLSIHQGPETRERSAIPSLIEVLQALEILARRNYRFSLGVFPKFALIGRPESRINNN